MIQEFEKCASTKPMSDSGAPQQWQKITLRQVDIMVRANEKWVAAGMPKGDGSRFWSEAEQELRHEAVEQIR